MRPCTRELSSQKLSLEMDCLYGTNTINTNFPTQTTLDGVPFDFFCHKGSLDGRDVQAGWTYWLNHQRHVGKFFVFLVCGVWFNLQNLHFIPEHFVAFFVHMSGYLLSFKQTLCQVTFVLLNAYF
jgi:hypothetical protein